MKAGKNHTGIDELFRNKLENASVMPDASFNTRLMHTLSRREFMKFIPRRFNIYYLGGLLVAVTAGVLVISGQKKPEKPIPVSIAVNSSTKTITNTDTGTIFINKNKAVEHPSLKADITSSGDRADTAKTTKTSEVSGESRQIVTSESRTNMVTPAIQSPLTKNSIFSNQSVDSKTLKATTGSGGTLIEPSVINGCAPLKIHFKNLAQSGDSCIWAFGDGGFSNDKNPDWVFDTEGEYNVILKVFGEDKVLENSTVTIKVHGKPQARFESSIEKAVIQENEVRFKNFSTEGDRYHWNFGDGTSSDLFEPIHQYTKFGTYNVSLVVTSEFGCIDSLTVQNVFSGSEYFIDFPNAFIPNRGGPTGGYYSSKSDEATQVFHPYSSGVVEYQLRIYSKLGILLFESDDVNIGWDGYFKGQLSNAGVYIWKVRGKFRNGESFVKMGDVTLLSN